MHQIPGLILLTLLLYYSYKFLIIFCIWWYIYYVRNGMTFDVRIVEQLQGCLPERNSIQSAHLSDITMHMCVVISYLVETQIDWLAFGAICLER